MKNFLFTEEDGVEFQHSGSRAPPLQSIQYRYEEAFGTGQYQFHLHLDSLYHITMRLVFRAYGVRVQKGR